MGSNAMPMLPPIRFTLVYFLAAAAFAGAGHASAFGQAAPAADDFIGGEEVDVPEEPWQDPERPPVLTKAGEIRSLSPAQAAAGRPVRVRGVVTSVIGTPPFMFVQDMTGGVCVSLARDREERSRMRLGTVVQVEGVTSDGGNAPYVTGAGTAPVRIEVLGKAPVPRPRAVTPAELRTAAYHGEWVEVEGIVRSVHTEWLGPMGPAATFITVSQGEGRVAAVLYGRTGDPVVTEQFVGAAVRARGVFNAASPDRQEWPVMRVSLRTVRDLVVREKPTPRGELPVLAVGSLATTSATQPSTTQSSTAEGEERARVQGVVTVALRGRGMFVQDGSGGVWIEPPAGDPEAAAAVAKVRPSDRVDVVGFPDRRGWSNVVSDATWEVTGRASLPFAPQVTPETALAPGMNGRLVRIDGLVLSTSRLSDQTTLVLQSGSRVILARLADPQLRLSREVRDGDWVRATGVCVQSGLAEAWEAAGAAPSEAGADPRARSFHLLLAGPQAVELIGAPGWWTPARVLAAVGFLAALALVSFAWVVALRRRVARQTALIRQHVANQTLYEERVRIARDLHDSLEQDLLGITMQLNATDKLLGQPEHARRSLQLAAAMVRRSQAETHRAVWDLRERRPGQDGLVATLREAVAGLAPPRAASESRPDAVPSIEVHVQGEQRELPPQVENHLLRVALEAVTNAVKHAAATRIDIDLSFAEKRVDLRVRDDGRGFDADRLPPPSSGHFGLFGMRERAEKLGGDLLIRSRPGEGTAILLSVPLASNGAGPTSLPAPPQAVAAH